MTITDVPRLVDPEWLEAHLDEPNLRILDCTVHNRIDWETGDHRAEPAREDWVDGHVPGSVFADVVTDLSADAPDYRFQMPAPEAIAGAMERLGVGDDDAVVCYDATGDNMWAARVWWLLRAVGFDRAGVLDGGWDRWVAEGRPVSTDRREPPPATFTSDPRPDAVADRETVLASLDDDRRRLVSALRPKEHRGEAPARYCRSGRIPGSVNVPAVGADGVVDPTTGRFRSPAALRETFAAAGAFGCDRVVTYCGGAIAACSVAFALTLAGVEDVAVYDGGLSEWGCDHTLPMARG
jgi:thiosulfate/3-mercaptopyruvate sulfurtransferase